MVLSSEVGKLCLGADTKRHELSFSTKFGRTPPKNMWNELEMTASFRGVGSLNLQQLSSVLSSLCPGMLAEARNLPRTFLQNDGDRKWIS